MAGYYNLTGIRRVTSAPVIEPPPADERELRDVEAAAGDEAARQAAEDEAERARDRERFAAFLLDMKFARAMGTMFHSLEQRDQDMRDFCQALLSERTHRGLPAPTSEIEQAAILLEAKRLQLGRRPGPVQCSILCALSRELWLAQGGTVAA